MYILNWKQQSLNPNKAASIQVPVGSIVSDKASLRFTGKGAANYGTIQQENLMRLLEHFADSVAPLNPTVGQLWYDTANNVLQLCASTSPLIWKSIAGIQIGTSAPNPATVGDMWFHKSGSASGILYIYTGVGRHPSTESTIGGWEQVWPQIENVAGREEYDAMLDSLLELIGPVERGGNNAYGKSINNLTKFDLLDADKVRKYNALAVKDPYVLVPTTALTSELLVDPTSQDWDLLLAALRYAISRLELPPDVLNSISPFPFITDGRPVAPDLLTYDTSDPRYPTLERRSNRRFGIATLARAYQETVNVISMAKQNRYTLKGINGNSSQNTNFNIGVKTFDHKTFDGYVGNLSTVSNTVRFNFASRQARDEFFNSGAMIQITATVTGPQNVAGRDFKALADQRGTVRINADRARVYANSQPYVLVDQTTVGLKNSTESGVMSVSVAINPARANYQVYIGTPTATTLHVTWVATISSAVAAHLSLNYSIIRDTETYLAPALTEVFPYPRPFQNTDWSGSPFLDPTAIDPTSPPPPPPPPVGEQVFIPDRNTNTYSFNFTVPLDVTEISAVIVGFDRTTEAFISRAGDRLLSTTQNAAAWGAAGGGGDGGTFGGHFGSLTVNSAPYDYMRAGGGAGGYNGNGGAGGTPSGRNPYRQPGARPATGSGGGAGGESYTVQINYGPGYNEYVPNTSLPGGAGGPVGLFGAYADGLPRQALPGETDQSARQGGTGSEIRGPYVGAGARNSSGGNLRWRNNIPVVPGEVLTVNLGTMGTTLFGNQPGARIIWGANRTYPYNAQELNPAGQTVLSGTTTFRVPPNVTSISVVAQEVYPQMYNVTEPVEVIVRGTVVCRASNNASQRVGDGGGSGGPPGNGDGAGSGGAGNFGTGSGFTGNGGQGGTSDPYTTTTSIAYRDGGQYVQQWYLLQARGGGAGTGAPFPGGNGGTSYGSYVRLYRNMMDDGGITYGYYYSVEGDPVPPGGSVTIGGSTSPEGGGGNGRVGGALAYKNNIPVTAGEIVTVNAAKGRVRIIFGPGRVFPTNMGDV